MVCSKCGKELREGARFCHQCGNKISVDTVSAENTKTTTAASNKKNPQTTQNKQNPQSSQGKKNPQTAQNKPNSQGGQGKKNPQTAQNKPNSQGGQGKKNPQTAQNKQNSQGGQGKKNPPTTPQQPTTPPKAKKDSTSHAFLFLLVTSILRLRSAMNAFSYTFKGTLSLPSLAELIISWAPIIFLLTVFATKFLKKPKKNASVVLLIVGIAYIVCLANCLVHINDISFWQFLNSGGSTLCEAIMMISLSNAVRNRNLCPSKYFTCLKLNIFIHILCLLFGTFRFGQPLSLLLIIDTVFCFLSLWHLPREFTKIR
ncbi:MAG: zinc-ribbon domain-containing protein [Ruminococcaceae bacterium]|nr:zinc-ribbon domain-containing protein [Oscillospiraceae bacterium]